MPEKSNGEILSTIKNMVDKAAKIGSRGTGPEVKKGSQQKY